MSERRDTTRIPARFEVRYIQEGDFLISLSNNISIDGMYFHTEEPLRVGEITQLSFSIGDLIGETVNVQVMWVTKRDETGRPGVGVRFIDPPAHLQEEILRLINRVALIDSDSF